MKETINPVASMPNSLPANENPYFTSFKKLAPNITGTARKNENSAATVLDVPKRTAPSIVEPDLDVPGTSARIWKTPIKRCFV